MRYHIITIGCQMNKSDSERIASFLKSGDFQPVNNYSTADLVILTTCGVRQSAEDRAYGLVNRIRKENKKGQVIITGCLANRPDVKKRLGPAVDLFMPINDLPKIFDLLKLKSDCDFSFQSRERGGEKYLKIKPDYQSRFSAFVPIGNGCNNFCSYCVVPYARGREIYRPAKEIIEEVKTLIAGGYKEIILIAQNVNSYCHRKTNFPKLLVEIAGIPGDFWLRFSSSHPKDLSRELIKAMASSDKICHHLHIALQSGDNQILRAMNRQYTAKQFGNLIKKIRLAKPGIAITTDIIVGFPGEKKKQFEETFKIFKDLKFEMAYISQYSPRPGTAAVSWIDDVSRDEKKQREKKLTELLEKISLAANKKYVNKISRVLIEGKDKSGQYYGKNSEFKMVKVSNSQEFKKEDLSGRFVELKINKANNFRLEGEIVKDSQAPKVLVILGATSTGKTSLAVKLALDFSGEIISADSRQVYKGMDIGSGKDLSEYKIGRQKIPYHLIDVVSPKTEFNLAKYQKLAQKAIINVLNKNKLPIIVGGSGLYLQALVDNYCLNLVKPNLAKRRELEKLSSEELFKKLASLKPSFAKKLNNSERHNKRRLVRYLEIILSGNDKLDAKNESPYDFLILGLDFPNDILRQRIKKRLLERLDKEGLVEELKKLHQTGVSWKRLISFGLEYRFVTYYCQGKMDYQTMVLELERAIYRFAKRQKTWFKRWQKQGRPINWVKNKASADKLIKEWITKTD